MGKETDVYSWGVLLWEMSSGARAWANLRYAQVGSEDLTCACQCLLCCDDDLMHAQGVCLVQADASCGVRMNLAHAQMGSRGLAWCTPGAVVLC